MSLWTYHRVTRQLPCRVCGKSDWCRTATHTDGRSLAICNRIQSDRPALGDGGGWLHIVGQTVAVGRHVPATVATNGDRPKLSPKELEVLHWRCRTALSPARLGRLADRLHVSAASLLRLGAGWHDELSAHTIPMRDSTGEVVGLRTRFADGSKRCVPGSQLGLIVPAGVVPKPSDDTPDVLLIAEGESDTAAGIDLGFTTIGRPGCGACVGMAADFVRRLRPNRVVILADADTPGQRGADILARRLAKSGTACRVLTLPDGAKDLRAWKLLPESNHHALAALIDAPADQTKDCHEHAEH